MFGAATDGGDYYAGTIFKWHGGNLSVVRSFDWSRDGGYPYSPLVQAADGSIFGATNSGGSHGYGTLFKLTGTTFSVVHNFSSSDAGGYPYGSLAGLADGTIVGSAQGATFYGSLFKWNGALTSLITFDPAQEIGYWPSGLTVASDGNVHGATFSGGAGGGGTLFRLAFNIPPSITDVTGPAAPVAVNVPALVTTTYTDDQPSGQTCTFAWGDGQPNTTVAGSSGTCSAAHPFIDAGVYTVTVTVTDAFGLSDTDTSAYVVVYDLSAGFVTGGGWIQSPAGAYTADSTLQGHANFGFIAKYQKGTTVPSGETAFRFEIGVLDFASVSYEWLIISGARAQYKGVGTVNGIGDYGFLLTAVDGQVTGGGGADRFRIKIWDRASGVTIYDNGMGTAETSNGADAEEINGSIVIHVK